LGKELAALHLLESPILSERINRYPISGESVVERPRYFAPGVHQPKEKEAPENGKVYVNTGPCFEGVRPEVWEFQVGGRQI